MKRSRLAAWLAPVLALALLTACQSAPSPERALLASVEQDLHRSDASAARQDAAALQTLLTRDQSLGRLDPARAARLHRALAELLAQLNAPTKPRPPAPAPTQSSPPAPPADRPMHQESKHHKSESKGGGGDGGD